jgi:hypothetical protein
MSRDGVTMSRDGVTVSHDGVTWPRDDVALNKCWNGFGWDFVVTIHEVGIGSW